MTAFSGKNFTLFVEGEEVGGARITGFLLNSELIECTHLMSQDASETLEHAGQKSCKISVQGLYTNSQPEQKILAAAVDHTAIKIKLYMGGEQKLTGKFRVSKYHRSADFDAEEIYEIELMSTGEINMNMLE